MRTVTEFEDDNDLIGALLTSGCLPSDSWVYVGVEELRLHNADDFQLGKSISSESFVKALAAACGINPTSIRLTSDD